MLIPNLLTTLLKLTRHLLAERSEVGDEGTATTKIWYLVLLSVAALSG